MISGTSYSASRAAHPGRPALPLRRRHSLLPTVLLVSFGLLPHAFAGGLADCRPITDAWQRLACYDALASAAAPDTTTPEALFGLDAQQSAALLQQRLGEEPVVALEQVVEAVAMNRSGKLRVQLANGQLWEQVDSDRLPLKAGDAVTIRRAALGSFLLSRPSGGRSIRVRRGEAGPP